MSPPGTGTILYTQIKMELRKNCNVPQYSHNFSAIPGGSLDHNLSPFLPFAAFSKLKNIGKVPSNATAAFIVLFLVFLFCPLHLWPVWNPPKYVNIPRKQSIQVLRVSKPYRQEAAAFCGGIFEWFRMPFHFFFAFLF